MVHQKAYNLNRYIYFFIFIFIYAAVAQSGTALDLNPQHDIQFLKGSLGSNPSGGVFLVRLST